MNKYYQQICGIYLPFPLGKTKRSVTFAVLVLSGIVCGCLTTEATTFPIANSGFDYPITYDNHNYGNKFSPAHPGVDLNGPGGGNNDEDDFVYAVANGEVVDVVDHDLLGYVTTDDWGGIVIKHDYKGTIVYSQYGHIDRVFVNFHDYVTKGQKIAEVGDIGPSSKGPHLHFEIRNTSHRDPENGGYWPNNSTYGYEDPEKWIREHGPYIDSNYGNYAFYFDQCISKNGGHAKVGWGIESIHPEGLGEYRAVVQRVSGGEFGDGIIAYDYYRKPANNAYLIRSGFYQWWRTHSSLDSGIGLPLNDEYETSIGVQQEFKNGFLVYDNTGIRESPYPYGYAIGQQFDSGYSVESYAFVDAYNRNGSFEKMGYPFPNGMSPTHVHDWGGLQVQDFAGRQFGFCIAVHNPTVNLAFIVRTGFWGAYQKLGGPAVVGAPLSDEFVMSENPLQSKQDFEKYWMEWDASTQIVTTHRWRDNQTDLFNYGGGGGELPNPDPTWEDTHNSIQNLVGTQFRMDPLKGYFFYMDDGNLHLTMAKKEYNDYEGADDLNLIVRDLDGNSVFQGVFPDDGDTERSHRQTQQTHEWDIPIPHRGTYYLEVNGSTDCWFGFDQLALGMNGNKFVVQAPVMVHDYETSSDRPTDLYFYAPLGTFTLSLTAHHRDNFIARVYNSSEQEVGSINVDTVGQPRSTTFNVSQQDAGDFWRIHLPIQDVTVSSDVVKYFSFGSSAKSLLFDPEWKRDEVWFRDDHVMHFKPVSSILSLDVVVDDFNNTEGIDGLQVTVVDENDQQVFQGAVRDPEDGNVSHIRYLGYQTFNIPVTPGKVYRSQFHIDGNHEEINFDLRSNAKYIITDRRILLNERLSRGNLYFYAPPSYFLLDAITTSGHNTFQTLRVYDSSDQEVGYLSISENGIHFMQEFSVPQSEVGAVWRIGIPAQDFALEATNIPYFSTSPDALFDFVKPATIGTLAGFKGESDTYATDVKVTLSLTDYPSGVQQTLYRMNAGGWQNYTTPLVIAENGSYVLEFYSIDNEGNQEDVQSLSFTVNRDRIAPQVLSHIPSETEYGVSATANIEITFSEPMNPTLTEQGFSIQPATQGGFAWIGDTLLFLPQQELSPGSVYVVTMKAPAQDVWGNPLEQTTSWFFYTAGRYGDVSGDDTISAFDASLILQQVVDLIRLPDTRYPMFTQTTADVSGDGDVSAFDAVLVLRYAVGMIGSFPVESEQSAPSLTPQQIHFQTPSLTVREGEAFTLPLSWQVDGALFSVQGEIHYDANVLEATSLDVGDLLGATNLQLGVASFAVASTQPLQTSDEIGNVQFAVKPTSYPASEISIRLEGLRLNDTPMPPVEIRMRLIPRTFALQANYPNPFNPETWVPYHLAEPSTVDLFVYSLSGKLVRHIHLGMQEAGVYTSRSRAIHWDGRNDSGEAVGSGVYLLCLRAGEFSQVRKAVVRK